MKRIAMKLNGDAKAEWGDPSRERAGVKASWIFVREEVY
jgi:hypothetical protein